MGAGQCQNQRRAFNATRKEITCRADHPEATSVKVDMGRGKTVANGGQEDRCDAAAVLVNRRRSTLGCESIRPCPP